MVNSLVDCTCSVTNGVTLISFRNNGLNGSTAEQADVIIVESQPIIEPVSAM
jgi:hypothetical protein